MGLLGDILGEFVRRGMEDMKRANDACNIAKGMDNEDMSKFFNEAKNNKDVPTMYGIATAYKNKT